MLLIIQLAGKVLNDDYEIPFLGPRLREDDEGGASFNLMWRNLLP
jgi:hypothetical protein